MAVHGNLVIWKTLSVKDNVLRFGMGQFFDQRPIGVEIATIIEFRWETHCRGLVQLPIAPRERQFDTDTL
jgi:hypothetical protein